MATRFSDPATVPMGSNRLSPIDQAGAIAYDTAVVQSPFTNKDGGAMLRQATSNLAADSAAGRYGVAGIGDLGQFAGAFDPALSPMGNNRLSPVDQYKLIKQDAGLLSGDVTLANYKGPLPFGTTEALNNNSVSPQVLKDLQNAAAANLGGDSDVGRFAAPGYGDQGQFFGGDGGGRNTKNYDDISASAFAKGGDVQMPQEAGANPFADPNTMAVYDQMRQTVSPKEFGDEMLAGAAQIDPETMAQFRNELSQIDLSPEELDMLNNMVDEILANPEQYAAVRAKYLEMGAPEELLPEQFDPQFFAAMNMAVDQLIAEPSGVQAFAQGGIAELKPIAKVIASYGRNGDTMLAHITPAEARMLRRRGGSGTINPATGLPEFFLKKGLMRLGKAVKKFAQSTVGKIVLTVALGFFLGPAAASFMGVTSAAGVAAVSGFIGGAGSTLLAGGNLKQALKAGAIGGLTAGAGAAVGGAMGGTNAFASGSYSGAGLTPGQAFSGQVDKFTNMFSPSATVPGIQAPGIDAAGQTRGLAPTDVTQAPYKPLEMTGTPSKPFDSYFGSQPPATAPVSPLSGQPAVPSFSPEFAAGDPGAGFEPYNKVFADAPARVRAPVNFVETPAGANEQVYRSPSSGMADVTTNTARDLTRPANTSYFDQAKNFYNENISPSGIQQQGATDALSKVQAQFPGTTPEQIMNAPANSVLGKAYASAMPGIFSTYAPVTALGLGAIGLAGGFKATDAEPSEMRGELMKPVTQRIAEGGNQRNFYMQGLPGVKYDQYGAPIFGQNVPLTTFDTGLGVQSLINPRAFAAGGAVTAANFDETAYLNANPDVKAELARLEGRGSFKNAYEHFVQYGQAEGRTAFDRAETAAAAAADAAAKEAAQAANRKVVADAKAAKKAAGFGDAYKNINAGLSYDVPAGIAATSIAARQAAFAPKLSELQNSMMGNSLTLATPETQTYLSKNPDVMQAFKASNYGMSPDQYAQAHYQKFGKNEGRTMPVRAPVTQPYNNASGYGNAINNPVLPAVNYSTTPVVATPPPVEKKLMNMGGIASLRSGGYPRKTGQINGPGTGTSDSIPAMLSDGEFVMTAKAVRGAGKGDRRAGAKRMYALMNQLEKNAARG